MRIAIVGANGFTGRRTLLHFLQKPEYEVFGLSLSEDKWPGKGYQFLQTDITDHQKTKEHLASIRPDVVINASALSVVDYCETHREEAYAANTLAVKHLALTCEELNSRLIHISTDFVFSGKSDKLYTEDDIAQPVNYYGETKLLGENEVIANCSNHAVARVVVVYGKALPGQHGNIIQLVKSKLENNETVKVVTDQYRTPTWVADIAQGLELLANSRHNGAYHLCGAECLSIADIAYRVADFFKLDPSFIIPVTTKEMNEVTPRPLFSGLSIEKAKRDLNYSPHSLEEGMSDW